MAVVFDGSSPTVPIILSNGAAAQGLLHILKLAQDSSVKCDVASLADSDYSVRSTMERLGVAMDQGMWLVTFDAQLATQHLLDQIVHSVTTCDVKRLHPSFRLWIVTSTAEQLPSTILVASQKVSFCRGIGTVDDLRMSDELVQLDRKTDTDSHESRCLVLASAHGLASHRQWFANCSFVGRCMLHDKTLEYIARLGLVCRNISASLWIDAMLHGVYSGGVITEHDLHRVRAKLCGASLEQMFEADDGAWLNAAAFSHLSPHVNAAEHCRSVSAYVLSLATHAASGSAIDEQLSSAIDWSWSLRRILHSEHVQSSIASCILDHSDAAERTRSGHSLDGVVAVLDVLQGAFVSVNGRSAPSFGTEIEQLFDDEVPWAAASMALTVNRISSSPY